MTRKDVSTLAHSAQGNPNKVKRLMFRSAHLAGLAAAAIALTVSIPQLQDGVTDVRVANVHDVTDTTAETAATSDTVRAYEIAAGALPAAAAQQAFTADAQLTISVSNASAAAGHDRMGPPEEPNDADSDDAGDSGRRTPLAKMSGPVAALAAAGGPGLVELVVRYDDHPQLFDDAYVESLGGTVTRSYATFDMRAIEIPAGSLIALASDDNVDWLSLDDAMSITSVASREAANVPTALSSNAGYTGSKVGIAVLDTGVAAHADLNANVVQYSFLNGSYPVPLGFNGVVVDGQGNVRDDKFGHGTHVAGVLTGSGVNSGSQFEGSAKGATVLSLQVLDENGGGSMSDVMAALDWLLQYGSYYNIRVVNLSLGKGISESNTTDPLVLAVEQLWDAGMVVVVAAGNDGHSGSQTITSPGNSRKVITVGSMTDAGTGADFSDDYVSSFSSRGPTIGDLVLKPDLVAPGNRVVAAVSPTSKLAVHLPNRVVACTSLKCSGSYLELSGTSMATPMVSAAVALMLEKEPTLTPATVKARLMRSARKIDDNPANVGAGLLDVDAAMNDTGTIAGEALSPLMVRDDATNGVLVEDPGLLWGGDAWSAGYLYNDGFTWAAGYGWTDGSGAQASGYMWTDSGVWAKGYGWTDTGVSAKGYGWTDGEGVDAKSLLEDSSGGGLIINDDP